MDMAVGVIIGGAFSGIVTSLTDNFINPVLNVLTGGKIIIMAFILFCLMKAINKLVNLSKPEEKPAAPTTKVCPFCQSKISIKATRCPHCTSVLEENVAEEK